MNDKLLSVMTFLLLISGAGTIGYVGLKSYLQNREHEKMGELGCVAHRETQKMSNESMQGILNKEALFDILHGYYKCNPVKKGELVFFTPSPTVKPVVRKLWGLPGDSFSIVETGDRDQVRIKINGEEVSIADGPLVLSDKEAQALKSFETARHGVLGPDEYIIFGHQKPLFNDSSRFGIVKSSHFKGRVVAAKP